jgi:photosystem II stability/assembly factor-like uncharacterized protein
MKKNMVRAKLSLFLLIGFTASAHAQWTKTNWPASNGFFNLNSGQTEVFNRTWDSLNGGCMFLTADNGATWTQISSEDSSIGILSIVMLNGNILAGTWDGLYQSTSGGATWKAVTPTGIPANTVIWSIAMIATTLFAGTKGSIYKSSDSGTTWTEVKTGIPASARIRSLVANRSAIFAGGDSDGVYATTNSGTNWTAVNSGLADKRISQLVALGAQLFAVTLSGVFISGNNGASWTANSSSLKKINCFIVINNQLFAGTDSSGVYLSADSGGTWTSYNAGMPANTRVWSLAASNGYLFAGTSSGVWRSPFSTTSVPPRLTSSRVQFRRQNSSLATIVFTLSSPERVDLELYDLGGDRVLSLVHKKYGAGMQRFSFDTRPLAQGSYIIRLMAGMATYQQIVSIQR